MPGQAAIDFGRTITGGAGPGDDAVDQLSREVFGRLSSKGLYKDPSGSWQIKGMERPDITRGLRDSAVSAMGGNPWSKLVGASDARASGPASGMAPARSSGQVPQPGLGGVPQVGQTPKPSVPQPGLGGVPQASPRQAQVPGITSGLGASIANKVQSSIGMPGQAQTPTTSNPGSIQQVVESAIRGRGLTPPTGGPLSSSAGTTTPIVGPTRTNTGMTPGLTGGASVPWPNPGNSGSPPINTTGGGPQTPTQTQVAQGNIVPYPSGTGPIGQAPQPGLGGVPQTGTTPQVTMYPDPASQQGNAYSPTLGAPQGTIPSNLNIAYGRGGDWATVNQYDALYTQYGNQYGVDPAMLKAMAVIESGGQMIPNGNGSGAYGIMQINTGIWGQQAASMGYDLNTPEGQIGFAAAFLGGAVPGVSGSTPEERFINSYYPTECLDCPGEDGHTPRQYLEDIATLTGIINGSAPVQATPGATPTGNRPISEAELTAIGASSGGVPSGPAQAPLDPRMTGIGIGSGTNIDHSAGIPGHIDPATGQFVPDDPMAIPPAATQPGEATGGPGNETPARPPTSSGQYDIVYSPASSTAMAAPGSDEVYMTVQAGGAEAPISSEFGGPVLDPSWYNYQLEHGMSNTEHGAYDIAYPSGTPISATGNLVGTVECSSCGSYCTGGMAADGSLYCDGVGVGEVRVALDPSYQGGNTITMLYGHMLTSNVQAGQAVTEGTSIGTTGYAGSGAHLHQEARAYCPGMGYGQDGSGEYRLIDPTLVADGFYQTHDACTDQPF